MNYAAPSNRVIRTTKKLNTVCRLTKEQRRIREYCRSHDFVIKIDDATGEIYAVATEKKDVHEVSHDTAQR